MTRVAAYVPDLMDRSRLSGIDGVVFVGSPDALVEQGAVINLVDLQRAGVLDVLGRLGGRIVGFAGHGETELLATAREAGVEAHARSAFFRNAVELVG